MVSFNLVSKLISLPVTNTWTNCTKIIYHYLSNFFHSLRLYDIYLNAFLHQTLFHFGSYCYFNLNSVIRIIYYSNIDFYGARSTCMFACCLMLFTSTGT